MVKEDNSEPEHMRKLFIGGLSYQTNDQGLKTYFERFGEIVDVVVMKDTLTKRSKGFGFVTFSEAYMVDETQKNRPHTIDGRAVDTKRAVPRDEASKPGFAISVKKLFVGGIKEDVEESDLREVFSQFGEVVAVSIPIEKESQKKRGFAFVEFADHDAVDKACCECPYKDIQLKNRSVDVKKALSKEEMQSRGGGRGGGSSARGRGGNSWSSNQSSAGGWGGNQNSYGTQGGATSGYGSQSSYGSQVTWQTSSPSHGYGGYGGESQGWGGASQQPNSYGSAAGYGSTNSYGSASSASAWSQPATGDFGNGYSQSYGGGPMRAQAYGQPSITTPYNAPGTNLGGQVQSRRY